jgi:Fis family transcriptional regulator
LNVFQTRKKLTYELSGNHGMSVTKEGQSIFGQTQGQTERVTLKECVKGELDSYFTTLDGQVPSELHKLVMTEVEEALIRYVMMHCNENQCRVSEYLGINRGTLRKRLKEYGL